MNPIGAGSVVKARYHGGTVRELTLVKEVNSGGEGIVYHTSDPKLVAKIFLPSQSQLPQDVAAHDKRLANKRTKLETMIDPMLDPRSSYVAWPKAIIDGQGPLQLGYVMPFILGKPILFASEPALRQGQNLHLDLYQFYLLALNIANAMHAIHAKGHVLGDFKDLNCLFDAGHLTASLIDTDSFGISTDDGGSIVFPPDATTDDWSPREFLAHKAPVGQAHDLFSLAVYFHSLFFGTHPFRGGVRGAAGEAGAAVPQAIIEGAWLYGHMPRIKLTEHEPPFDVVSPGLQGLFRRAFVDGHLDPGQRPAAREWGEMLAESNYDLVWCDRRSLHVYDLHHQPKPRGKVCPWCAMKHDRFSAIRDQTESYKHAVNDLIRLTGNSSATSGSQPSDQRLELITRRLKANPKFRNEPRIQPVLAAVARYEQRKLRIDEAIGRLLAAETRDLDLIGAARRAAAEPAEVLAEVRKSTRAGRLLDRGLRLGGCHDRLRAAVDTVKPDTRGRYTLAGEHKVVAALRAEVQLLAESPTLAAQFEPRVSQARERIEAAAALHDALTARPGAEPALAALQAMLGRRRDRLVEIVDADVAAWLELGESIARLAADLDRPAAEVADRDLVAAWERHIISTKINVPILDAPALSDGASLRQAIERSRKSVAAIGAFELVLAKARAGHDQLSSDQSLAAADPTAELTDRGRAAFATSAAGQLLAAAQARLKAIDRIERAAQNPDRNARDLELMRLWDQAPDRDRLTLSAAIKDLVRNVRERLERFTRIVAVAIARPPADDRLIKIVSVEDPAGDLSGFTLPSGQTLGERVQVAYRRLALRNTVDAAIVAADSSALTLAGEQAIVDAANAASSAETDAPTLLVGLKERIDSARRRLEGHRQIGRALAARDGGAVRLWWARDRGLLGKFPPVKELLPQIERILAEQDALEALIERARANLDADEAIVALAEECPAALDLADAKTARADLDGLSLASVIERSRLRRGLFRRLDQALLDSSDPGQVRDAIAQLAQEWKTEYGFDHPGLGPYAADLKEACAARDAAFGIAKAIGDHDGATVVSLWDEAWHLLLQPTASMVSAAQRLVRSTVADRSPPADAVLKRIGPDWLRLSWRWSNGEPFGKAPAAAGCEILTIVLVLTETSVAAREHSPVLTVFRATSVDGIEGQIDLHYVGRRLRLQLRAGCLIGGEAIMSNRSLDVSEPKLRLEYKMSSSGWTSSSDVLHLHADRPLATPVLQLVHMRTGRPVKRLPSVELSSSGRGDIDLSDRGPRGMGALLKRTLNRLSPGDGLVFSLALDTPEVDDSWVEIVHPGRDVDRRMSYMPEPEL